MQAISKSPEHFTGNIFLYRNIPIHYFSNMNYKSSEVFYFRIVLSYFDKYLTIFKSIRFIQVDQGKKILSFEQHKEKKNKFEGKK